MASLPRWHRRGQTPIGRYTEAIRRLYGVLHWTGVGVLGFFPMYAFIHIPKTAGSTLRACLRASYGARHCDVRVPMRKRASHAWLDGEDLRKALWVYRGAAGICGHRVTPFNGLQAAVPDIRFFTVLRDPIQRCISHFLHFHRGAESAITPDELHTFCADPHQRNVQTRWLCGTEDAQQAIESLDRHVGFVGLTERFDESMVLFHDWLNDERLQPGYVTTNRGQGKPAWAIADDPTLRAVVAEANGADTQLYRHVVEHRFPQQVAAFGEGLDDAVVRLQQCCVTFTPPRESTWASLKRNYMYKLLLHLRVV